MGLVRKALSVSTLGGVDYRSAKDKTARNTRKARIEARNQTATMERDAREARKARKADNGAKSQMASELADLSDRLEAVDLLLANDRLSTEQLGYARDRVHYVRGTLDGLCDALLDDVELNS